MSEDTIYEFRDYTLQPGKRDTLIDLFEREFIEPQEALGSHVRATFRDLDRPNHFVWIRSFADAQSRFAALDGFYTGPVWQAHRDAARDTMIDTDNVMQLRPVAGSLAYTATAPSLIVATAYFLAPHAEQDFIARFSRDVAPHLDSAAPFATFVTDPSPNAYPRLPVRENETVFLTLSRFASPEAHAQHLASTATARATIAAALGPMLIAPVETRRLQPTARSALR